MKLPLSLVLVLGTLRISVGAHAGDGNLSSSSLSAMGLSGLKTLSDAQGLAIRGRGALAAVSGSSFAVQVGLGGIGAAGSNYAALGFGNQVAGAQGTSASAAHFIVLGTPTLGATAATASGALAGQQ
jgi:hypothetical protein